MVDLQNLKNAVNVQDLASYCYACGACDSVCPTNMLQLFSPRSFIVKLVNEGVKDLDNFVEKSELFNCLTCKQCSIHCPMFSEEEEFGVKFVDIIQELRAYGYERNLITKQLQKHKTHDFLMQELPKLQGIHPDGVNKVDFLQNDKSLKSTIEGDYGFFVGCMGTMENTFYNYGISYRDNSKSAVKLLNKIGIEPVIIDQKCCGHDAYWIGDVNTAQKLAEYNVEKFKKAGVKTVIVNCAEGYRMWKTEYPKLVDNCDFEVKHLSEILTEKGIQKKLRPISDMNIKVTYHDPCRLGRMSGVYDQPRQLIESIKGVELVEMIDNKENSLCCGISAFMGCNGTTKRIRQTRIDQAVETKAEYLITTCPKCITHFSCYLNETNDEGKERTTPPKINVMDLATFINRMTN